MTFDFSQIIARFNNLEVRARYAIFGAVVLALVLLDIFLMMGPQWRGIIKLNQEGTVLSEDIKGVSADKQRIDQLKKSLANSSAQLQAMNLKIRLLQEVPSILEDVSSVANEFGVKIDQLMPQKQEQESLITSPEGRYYALPIVIQVRCGYHMFGRFLNKLENGNLYFTLRDLIVEGNGKDPNSHLFALTIKVILVDKTPSPQAKKS